VEDESKGWNALEYYEMLRRVGGFDSDWSRPRVMQEDGSSPLISANDNFGKIRVLSAGSTQYKEAPAQHL
jgi:hypothetical protein